MKKYITKDLLLQLFIVFLIVQPIIDIYILFKQSVVDFFGFSPATIIRIIFVGIICILFLFTNKFKKVYLWLLGYLLLVGIYVILHHYNALNFVSNFPGDFNYSLKEELFYIIRMLMPLSIIFIAYHLKFSFENFKKVISYLVILVSGSIVVTNVLKISLGSYSKITIKDNIFGWFIDAYDKYNYFELASKGFFNDPNRISALLVLMTPILIYILIKDFNKKNISLFAIQFLAMFMMGTKVTTIGIIGMIFIFFFIYLYFIFIKKELILDKRIIWFFVVSMVLSVLLSFYAPAMNRTKVDVERSNDYKITKKASKEKDQFEKIELITKNMTSEERKKYLVTFIGKEYNNFSINPQFIIKSYSYKYDPEFWLDIMQKPLMERTKFRYIEQAMLQRVKDINNNDNDNWLGITFARMQNIFDLERDFLSHYYTLGMFGLILLLFPYPIIVIVCGIKMLINYKENFNLMNVLFIFALIITLFAAFYSGNVMDGLVVTLLLSFIMGQLLRNIFIKD